MINQIQFNEFKGGLKSWEAYNQIYTVYIYIYIYIVYREVRAYGWGKGGGGAYQCGSLEAAFTLSGLFYFLH